MTQYRVKLRITTETLVDMTADTPEMAGADAAAALGGNGVEVLSVWAVSGQAVEPDIAAPISRFAVLQGEEDGA